MKQLFENKTNSPMYAMGTMIPPGESVLVEVPGEDSPVVVAGEPTLAEQVAVELKKPVKDLLLLLPSLSLDALDMMFALENGADRPRVTLITALSQEQLQRSNAVLEADDAKKRQEAIDAAQSELAAAKGALDAETDPGKHPALEAVVKAAQAKVDALTADAQH